MSEDDRAAKAARAKAMLKKRQQKKVVEPGAPLSDVTSPPSRTMTPALSDMTEEAKRSSIDDVFGAKNESDTSWLSSLPRAQSPPHAQVATPSSFPSTKSPPPSSILNPAPREMPLGPSTNELVLEKELTSLRSELASVKEKAQRSGSLEDEVKEAQRKNSKLEELLEQERAQHQSLISQFEELRRDTDSQLSNDKKTISLLVSEKATLTSELNRLDEAETRAQTMEESLNQEKERTTDLNTQLQNLREHVNSITQSLEGLQHREKEMNEKFRERERQLQLSTASLAEARKDAERYQRSLKELEEQIQNDDRVERVEASLRNTQDRADELEFQLTKLKHAHSLLKAEKEDAESRLKDSVETKTRLELQNLELEKEHEITLKQLAKVTEEKESLATERTSLDQSSQAKDTAIANLSSQLSQAAAEIGNQKRQVQALQTDLKTALRRVDDAEKVQLRLQAEGTNLMRSLDELRPKVVELTEDKLQLADKVAHLEHTIRDRDNAISGLETRLEDARQEAEKQLTEWNTKLSKSERERSEVATSSSEMEKGFSDLQKELENALDSVHRLESERQSLRQDAQSRLQELEYSISTSRAQAAEITKLQYELNERRAAQEEEEDFLEQAQTEIESLRAELNSKTAELEQLRSNHPPLSQNGSPPSLNEEMLNSLRQQHALDLSAAQSQIRALENSVFDAEARAHGLQRQMQALETQIAQARPNSRLGQRSFSPSRLSRPASRAQPHSDLGRSSFNSQRPSALSRSVFDQGMTPETRHKRKVSLSMLKARIDSEVASTGPPSRALSPVHSQEGIDLDISYQHQKGSHRPQFLDESHVFWCSSCNGELVVL